MDARPNTLATVSLICGILAFVLWFVQMCVGFIPLVGLIGILLIPVEWLVAFAGLVTGILGWRASGALDGAGRAPAMVGAILSGVWLLLQILLYGMAFMLFGFAFVVSLLSGNG